jgi:thiamine biosynthesis lipoprotein
LDFGAAGKGYLIDLVAKVLKENGVVKYCINAGGDILYQNDMPIRVGLENPANTEQVIGVCTLAHGSICGSAGNRRAWGDFTHIINPKTLSSPRNILAVWVCAKTAIVADALATCLFFVPAETLTDTYQFEYVIVRDDFSLEKSAHFPGELFVA